MSRLSKLIYFFDVYVFADACEILHKYQYGFRAKLNVSHPELYFSEICVELKTTKHLIIRSSLIQNKFKTQIFNTIIDKDCTFIIEKYLGSKQQLVHGSKKLCKSISKVDSKSCKNSHKLVPK